MYRIAAWLTLCATCSFGLDIGSTAPPLKIATWFNGKPVALKKGKVYVVEFWATWCRPCLQTIPHLSQLQKRLGAKGLTIVSVSNEPASLVKDFLTKHPEMDYCVAVDDKNQTSSVWMAGVRGIPHAFLVDQKGLIVWQGHPLGGLDRVAEMVATGTYTASERKAVALQAKLQGELSRGEFGAAESTCFEILRLSPERKQTVDLLFNLYVHVKKPVKELYPKLAAAFTGKPDPLAGLALRAATQVELGDRDLLFAVTVLKQAQGLTTEKSAVFLRAQARLEYMSGLIPRAITTAREAAQAAGDTETKKHAEADVAYYRAALQAQKKLVAD